MDEEFNALDKELEDFWSALNGGQIATLIPDDVLSLAQEIVQNHG